jgi:hypothetical protein
MGPLACLHAQCLTSQMLPTDSSKGDSDQVSNNSFDGAHKSHFKSTGPPGTDGDEGFRGPYSEMRHEGNDGGDNDGGVTRQEEERNTRDGPFYETAGALRDILQNHAMEVLALIAMEPPESFQAEAVRSEKT